MLVFCDYFFDYFSEILIIGAGLSLLWDWYRIKDFPDSSLDK